MRLFIAVNFPADFRDQLYREAEPVRQAAQYIRARWLPAEQLHVTVAFLGEQPEGRIADIERSLESVGQSMPAFDIELHGVGTFPNWQRPRVLWIGSSESTELQTLAAAVAQACRKLGIEIEKRPFHAHVTLARLDTGVPRAAIKTLEEAARTLTFRARARVMSIDLMRSSLGNNGSVHERVQQVLLNETGL